MNRSAPSIAPLIACLVLFFVVVNATIVMHSLPYWCATPNKPSSGNWIVQPLCTPQLTAMGRVALGMQSPTQE